jgi:hypothetical protein
MHAATTTLAAQLFAGSNRRIPAPQQEDSRAQRSTFCTVRARPFPAALPGVLARRRRHLALLH